jgi:crotonobetainyl-CoA:carnitine CoA-transferase CaiB-like acyl-CoA transferase
VADFISGMFAAQGIMAALLARERSGRGQHVDVAMLDAVTAMLTYQAGIWFATGEPRTRMGNRHPSIVPYDTFAAADGEFVLSVGNDDQFRRLSALLGRTELADDPRFVTNEARVGNHDALRAVLDPLLAAWSRDQLLAALTAAGVPNGAVRSVTEALADPQLAARDMIVPLEHATAGTVRVLGTPL